MLTGLHGALLGRLAPHATSREQAELALGAIAIFVPAGVLIFVLLRRARRAPMPWDRWTCLTRWCSRAMILFVASLAALQITASIFFRVDPGRFVDLHLGVLEAHDRLGWVVRPWLGPALDARLAARPAIRTGARGFWRESPEPAPAPQIDRETILLLGDSFFSGSMITPFDEVLRARLPRAGILNAAVPAYSIDQSIARWRQLGLDADLVVLGFYVGNDLELAGLPLDPSRGSDRAPEDRTSWQRHYIAGDGTLRASDDGARGILTRPFAAPRWLLERHTSIPALVDHVRAVVEVSRRDRGTSHSAPALTPDYRGYWEILKPVPGPETEAKWKNLLVALDEFHRTVGRSGARLAIVVIPADVQVSRRYWPKHPTVFQPEAFGDTPAYAANYPQKRLAAFCAEEGIPLLDLLPPFRASAETLYYEDDPHWNDAGNRLAGTEIARWIEAMEFDSPSRRSRRDDPRR